MKNNSDYSSVQYWNERYNNEEHFEWFSQSYQDTLDLLDEGIQSKTFKILILGCGNSNLSRDLYDRGYHDILSTDISSTCIQRQIESQGDQRPGLQWKVLDMTDMLSFGSESFDIVIEKATFDAFMVKEKSPWTISDATMNLIHRSLVGISRVLRKGGLFFSITFAQPHFRVNLFAQDQYEWSAKHVTINKKDSFHFYCWIMEKGAKQQEDLEPTRIRLKVDHDDTYFSDSENEDFLFNIEN